MDAGRETRTNVEDEAVAITALRDRHSSPSSIATNCRID
ncbi:uncharacterized protein G2W53_000939 [Senna tora]|uniref:Uncharacterized protein n=1 Tax=Senna tora TaxID=362788 RepID=A0A835CIZ2_9FABA|nr:uncharacterized protein G2W53_000939 [Senna tora]